MSLFHFIIESSRSNSASFVNPQLLQPTASFSPRYWLHFAKAFASAPFERHMLSTICNMCSRQLKKLQATPLLSRLLPPSPLLPPSRRPKTMSLKRVGHSFFSRCFFCGKRAHSGEEISRKEKGSL